MKTKGRFFFLNPKESPRRNDGPNKDHETWKGTPASTWRKDAAEFSISERKGKRGLGATRREEA